MEIVAIDVKDVRFPTSLGSHGSDALVSLTNTVIVSWVPIHESEKLKQRKCESEISSPDQHL